MEIVVLDNAEIWLERSEEHLARAKKNPAEDPSGSIFWSHLSIECRFKAFMKKRGFEITFRNKHNLCNYVSFFRQNINKSFDELYKHAKWFKCKRIYDDSRYPKEANDQSINIRFSQEEAEQAIIFAEEIKRFLAKYL